MPTTWSTSDKAAGITLSSGNHVATSASGNNTVRGTTSHALAGKFYLEYPANTVTAGSGCIGFADATKNLTNNALDGMVGISVTGGWNIGSGGGLGSSPNGKHVSFAIDFDNNRVWARYDGGLWNGSGTADPATNVGGIDLLTMVTTPLPPPVPALFPAVFIQNSGSNTLNAGDSAFTYTAPDGFVPWDSTPPYTQVQSAVIF